MRIALAQVNVTVGDLEGNRAKIVDYLSRARKAGADLAVFPELALTGYPPEDLLFKHSFIRDNLKAFRRLIPLTRGLTAIIGFLDRDRAGRIYNGAAVLRDGKLLHTYRKMHLPNYGVFDEKRYFTPGQTPFVFQLETRDSRLETRVGVSICEDIWVEAGPVKKEAQAGARLLVNLSASPYHAGKRQVRERLLIRRARALKTWICYLNLVGGQDELVFDGDSMIFDPSGRIAFRAPQFKEGLFLTEIPLPAGRLKGKGIALSRSATPLRPDREIFEALVLGTRDYVAKNRFSHVVVGMSGGIDSALTTAIAAAAVGKKGVTAVSMPSRYSSSGTRSDARAVARALGIGFLELSIEPVFRAVLDTLRPVFKNLSPDVTEENLQARVRGLLLMALSNKFGWLVLATGNKSEMSTGYCTLYGDMVGGFAVIKDLPKTWVYQLSRTANRVFGRRVIPESIFRRPPSAELKPHQRDQDTLPPYPRLDRVLRAYVEEDRSPQEIRKQTQVPAAEVEKVLRMIDLSEYKRRQAPIGIKITPRAFGKDRRMPITNRYNRYV